MAISIKDRYPSKVDTTDAAYPQGKARNVTVTLDGTGTPFEKDLVNDIMGLQQAIYKEAGITPSGTPDTADVSQQLDGLKKIVGIDDLSKTYTFATVAAFKASTIAFPVGKVVHLKDRDADFTVIAGTGTATGNGIISSTTVSQSITLVTNRKDPKSWGATSDGVDSSSAINEALASESMIHGKGLLYSVASSLTVRENKAANLNLKALTAGMSVVLVNKGSKLFGDIEGTGTVSIIERGVYPAQADTVDRVIIKATIHNLTVGIHAQPTTGQTPKGWVIDNHIYDIVGTTGASEGYGVLLSPAHSCSVRSNLENIKRHAVYLSAGARGNKVDIEVDGCDSFAVQLFSTSTQPATTGNSIRGMFTNLTEFAAGQGGAVGLLQQAIGNDVSITMIGEGNTTQAVKEEGGILANELPTNNHIHDCTVTGGYIGDVILSLNGQDSKITGNNIYASWGGGAVNINATVGNVSTYSAQVTENKIRGNGGVTSHGILNSAELPYHASNNDIRDISGFTVQDVSIAKSRTGFNKTLSGSAVLTVGAATIADYDFVLSEAMRLSTRKGFAQFTSASVTTGVSLTSFVIGFTDTTARVRIYNSGGAQDIGFDWTMQGD